MKSESENQPGMMVAIGVGGADPCKDVVPADVLAMPGEDEQMAQPEPGDKVQYTIEGTVEKIENGQAVIKRETINGQPIQEDEENETPDEETQEQETPGAEASEKAPQYSDLEDQAKQMGGMM